VIRPRLSTLFQDKDLAARPGKVTGGNEPVVVCTNDDHLLLFTHCLLPSRYTLPPLLPDKCRNNAMMNMKTPFLCTEEHLLPELQCGTTAASSDEACVTSTTHSCGSTPLTNVPTPSTTSTKRRVPGSLCKGLSADERRYMGSSTRT
jgi:hypothetical protein